ncbi:MAG TPA: Fe-S cluster assembly scaffold protein NifU [Planctomycetota bacterium]|nr:Fe-S cluster assembly scaffold protein NifU [Planctomycetota bacterium]
MVEEQPYSEKVMEHFMEPHNVGELADANGVGTVGNPVCGDIMKLYIKVENNVIVDAKFKTLGCGAAIASSSILTDMIKGKTLEEVKKVSNDAVAEALGGLPARKRHCSVLAEEALQSALEDYYKRQNNPNAASPTGHKHECCLAEAEDESKRCCGGSPRPKNTPPKH